MKSAPCHRTIISLIKKIRNVKASALFAALYKEDMLHKTKASEGEARASKNEVPARVPKTDKIPNTIPVR